LGEGKHTSRKRGNGESGNNMRRGRFYENPEMYPKIFMYKQNKEAKTTLGDELNRD